MYFVLNKRKFENTLCKFSIVSFFLAETMRVSIPPVRFSDPKVIVPPRREVVLKPFQGQPRKYAKPLRLPQLVLGNSTIKNAGIGLFLGEDVRAGQVFTIVLTNK